MVSNHEMRNISYITQDPEDRRVFAYIAKDAKTDKHYCHVFRMDASVSGARLIFNSVFFFFSLSLSLLHFTRLHFVGMIACFRFLFIPLVFVR